MLYKQYGECITCSTSTTMSAVQYMFYKQLECAPHALQAVRLVQHILDQQYF